MNQPGRSYPPLEPELEAVLVQLVDSGHGANRAARSFFATAVDDLPGLLVVGAGLSETLKVAPSDLAELAERGLVRVARRMSAASCEFHVTAHGRAYCAEIRQRGEPLERVQQEAVQFVDSEGFAATHPVAYGKWKHAYALCSVDPVGNATRIGHHCREAMMAFADSLTARGGEHVEARPEQTVMKVRAVLDSRGAALGATNRAFLSALLSCWGAVSDLVQRQTHGASKEGDGLDGEDGRRVVWYTALVMQELHRLA